MQVAPPNRQCQPMSDGDTWTSDGTEKSRGDTQWVTGCSPVLQTLRESENQRTREPGPYLTPRIKSVHSHFRAFRNRAAMATEGIFRQASTS